MEQLPKSRSIVIEEVEKDREHNLRSIIEHAIWEACMCKRLGREWFRIRDQWLEDSWKADILFLEKNGFHRAC